ncbi:MAG: DUF2062 domain-containing protein [Bacteroidetes bacterium]|nr:DUF2062 domain-containing protein [Bacteroidota bacterium]PIX35982.1 MAG: DUF2062 domain-containing protein [Bacteroidetes bacterium CG_4_8_14_3_um_filter_31_14]
MTDIQLYTDCWENKFCVIIPSYNNATKIEAVINDVLLQTNNVIVINDGATDNTAQLLAHYKNIKVISYPQNKGKGYAVKKGFKKAIELGYEYAITIDSDGQHCAEDISKFINACFINQNAIIIGNRSIIKGKISRKSSFANNLSNFWFLVITGIKLDDTQSGFRLYPIKKMQHILTLTRRYEFEIEIMVKASWQNIPIESIPISVIYPPENERISHFRPVVDFIRIGLLNSWLVFLSLTFFRPFAFIKKLNKKYIVDFFNQNLVKTKDNNFKIVGSIMFGVFMGIIPLWGYQLITAIALAYVFRLNKLIVGVAANISITPMIPVIIYLSYLTGGIVLGTDISKLPFNAGLSVELFTTNIKQYLIGSFVLASFVSSLIGTFFYILLLFVRKEHR